MSDFNVYIKTESDNVEYEIPDIYRDPDSETNSDQIKTYISQNLNIDYDNLVIDINRNGRIKRKCSNFEILDGDDLYVYFEKIQNIDFKKLKMRSGSYGISDLKFNTHNFKESDLKTILSIEDNHRSKIDEIVNIISSKLNDFSLNQDDIEFINSLTVMKYNIYHNDIYPFNNIDNNYVFCCVDKDKKPVNFGYMFDFKTNTYYEGNFNGSNIYHGKSCCFGNDFYYSTCTMYSSGLPVHNGTKKFLNRNELYTGCFVNGEYGNIGNLINDEGNYSGWFKNGKKFLFGYMKYKNGNVYSGFWNTDEKSHFGKMKYVNNDYFIGTWYNDKKIDFGTFYNSKRNITYVGTFKDDKETFNKDEFTLIKGHYYPSDFFGTYEIELIDHEDSEGNILFSQKLSKLIYDQDNMVLSQSKDISKFVNNQQIYHVGNYDYLKDIFGFGKLYYNSSSKIIHNFPKGDEIMTQEYIETKFKGYRIYHCNFINSTPNGFGKIDYENGDIYIGNIKNSLLNGYGTVFKSDGTKIKGFWNDNIIIRNITLSY